MATCRACDGTGRNTVANSGILTEYGGGTCGYCSGTGKRRGGGDEFTGTGGEGDSGDPRIDPEERRRRAAWATGVIVGLVAGTTLSGWLQDGGIVTTDDGSFAIVATVTFIAITLIVRFVPYLARIFQFGIVAGIAFWVFGIATYDPSAIKQTAENRVVDPSGTVGYFKIEGGTNIHFTDSPSGFSPAIPETIPGPLPLRIQIRDATGIGSLRLVTFTGFYEGAVPSLYSWEEPIRSQIQSAINNIVMRGDAYVLKCSYQAVDQGLYRVRQYWYRTVPEIIDPAALRAVASDHPLLLFETAMEKCPPAI